MSGNARFRECCALKNVVIGLKADKIALLHGGINTKGVVFEP